MSCFFFLGIFDAGEFGGEVCGRVEPAGALPDTAERCRRARPAVPTLAIVRGSGRRAARLRCNPTRATLLRVFGKWAACFREAKGLCRVGRAVRREKTPGSPAECDDSTPFADVYGLVLHVTLSTDTRVKLFAKEG